MRGRELWLTEGLTILAEFGVERLTIEMLCERTGLSKGSFYHHFGSMPNYRHELLLYFTERETMAFIQPLEGVPEGIPRLERLVSDVLDADLGRPRLEAAVRSWATADPEAQAQLTRVDDVRLDFIRQHFEGMGLARQAATEYATLGLLFSIGAIHIQPNPSRDQVTALWRRLISAAQKEDSPPTPQ